MKKNYIVYIYKGLAGRSGNKDNRLIAYLGKLDEIEKVEYRVMRDLESYYYVRFRASGAGVSIQQAVETALCRLFAKGSSAIVPPGSSLKAPIYDLLPEATVHLDDMTCHLNGGKVCFYHAGHLT